MSTAVNDADYSAPRRARYALRRTLPGRSSKNLDELIACLPKYRVDEVIVKIDTEEFMHGQPPLEWVEAYVPKLAGLGE